MVTFFVLYSCNPYIYRSNCFHLYCNFFLIPFAFFIAIFLSGMGSGAHQQSSAANTKDSGRGRKNSKSSFPIGYSTTFQTHQLRRITYKDYYISTASHFTEPKRRHVHHVHNWGGRAQKNVHKNHVVSIWRHLWTGSTSGHRHQISGTSTQHEHTDSPMNPAG